MRNLETHKWASQQDLEIEKSAINLHNHLQKQVPNTMCEQIQLMCRARAAKPHMVLSLLAGRVKNHHITRESAFGMEQICGLKSECSRFWAFSTIRNLKSLCDTRQNLRTVLNKVQQLKPAQLPNPAHSCTTKLMAQVLSMALLTPAWPSSC